MDDLAEQRVFAERTAAAELVVAASSGLVVVSLSEGRVGEFRLAHQCSPSDVAVGPAADTDCRVAVATNEDVLVAPTPAVDALEPTGFGEAVAVTVHGGQVVAGGPAGRLAVNDGADWTTAGELPSAPTSLAGDLIGTADGVFRLVDGSLRPAGLSAVADVALTAGTPLAATATGLYELGNGWLDVLAGGFCLVAGAPDGRAHAATEERFFERVAGAWEVVELASEGSVTAVAYGPRTYLLDTDGQLLVETGEGWARTPLGLEGVTAAAVL